MTFGEYVLDVFTQCPSSQRLGQWAFNLLYDIDPELANKVRATAVDPFYNDEIVPAFLTYVGESWNYKH